MGRAARDVQDGACWSLISKVPATHTMTHHNPPQFRPVPAVPITVISTTDGACRVLAGCSLFQGQTLCAVLDGVCKISGAAMEKKG